MNVRKVNVVLDGRHDQREYALANGIKALVEQLYGPGVEVNVDPSGKIANAQHPKVNLNLGDRLIAVCFVDADRL